MRPLSFESHTSQDGSLWQLAQATYGLSAGPDRAFAPVIPGNTSARLALYTGLAWRLSLGCARVAWLGEGWSTLAGDGVVPIDTRVSASGKVRAGSGALRELRRPDELYELLNDLPGSKPVIGILACVKERLPELADLLEDPWPIVEVLDGGELLMVLELARVPGACDTIRLFSPSEDWETDLELSLVDLNQALEEVVAQPGPQQLRRLMRGAGGLSRARPRAG